MKAENLRQNKRIQALINPKQSQTVSTPVKLQQQPLTIIIIMPN